MQNPDLQNPPMFGEWKQFVVRIVDRFKMAEHSFMVILAVFVGLVTGYGALGLRYLIHLIQVVSTQHFVYTLSMIAHLPWYQKLLMPAIGGLLVGPIVTFLSKEVKGHGVPEVMESIILRNGRIRPRVVFAKIVASSICIGSGGSSGREGPIVQIGSAIGSTIGQWFQLPPEKLRTLVAAGAAGGIAAAFNAPVAGALFAIEIIFGDFGVMQFSPIVIASVTATVVSRHYLGDFPAFIVAKYTLVSPWELIFYAGMGLIAGVAGLAFIQLLYGLEAFFDGWKFPDYIKPALGGLAVGAMGIVFPAVYGVGYEGINEALTGHTSWEILLALMVLKIVATSFTLGSGGSGGIFAPSLFIGAMIGGAVGTLVHQFFPAITATSGAYSMVGMGAFVGAVTHAPITSIIIIFEMTNEYKIILPLMIATIIAVTFTTKMKPESIYTLKLVKRGIQFFKGKEINVLKTLSVEDVYDRNCVNLAPDTRFMDIISVVMDSDHEIFCVVDENDRFLGYFTLRTIRKVMDDPVSLKNIILAYDLIETNPSYVTPDTNLDTVMKVFGTSGIGELPVVDAQNPHLLLGTLTRKIIIDEYNKELARREPTLGLERAYSSLALSEITKIVDNYAMVEIPAPTRFVGKSLLQLDLRKNYRVQVFLVERELEAGRVKRVVPDAHYTINEKDVLILLGEQEDLIKIGKL
jgi:CIC family chloride channel protein